MQQGVKLTTNSAKNENDESQFWKFTNDHNNNLMRKKYRDSIPNDGRLEGLKGIAARRVSIVIFLNETSSFSWKFHQETTTDVEVKKGRMLVFLSGAVETQVVNRDNNGEAECLCYATWLR